MAKLNKMYYYTKNEKKLNCYYINIPKKIKKKMGLQDKEVEVKQDGNRIVIQKSN